MANAVAIVGGESLRAGALREFLAETRPKLPLDLFSSVAGDLKTLSEQAGEPVILDPLEEGSLDAARVVFLAGSAASSRKALRLAPRALLIDLSASLEEQPQARLRAPWAEPEPPDVSKENIQVIAHPAAVAIAMLMGRLDSAARVARAVVHVFEPASERGRRGVEELQKQSAALFNFQKPPDDVYDTQAAFSMLDRYGEEAEEALEAIEQRIDRHLATLLGPWPRLPMPSMRLIQAPVFHGYSVSLWAELESNPGPEAIEAALASASIEVRGAGHEPITSASVASQSGVLVSAVRQDPNQARAVWIWAGLDNLRATAENAVAAAAPFLP